MKKLLALLLVLALALSMVACSGNKTPSTDTSSDTSSDTSTDTTTDTDTEAAPGELVDPYAYSEDDYDIQSEEIYDLVLGEFETIYNEAKAEVVDMGKRFAEMAIAEAKLLESGTFLPLTAKGGNYAISRVAPYTASTTLWGNDSDRFHNQVVTTEPITAADRDTLKAMWAELKGTGTWEAECEKWLTENGYTLKDTYTMGYASDPQTWDILATSQAPDAEALVNTFDGLVEYDSENVMQPALAESWEESEDGLTYTFHLRLPPASGCEVG